MRRGSGDSSSSRSTKKAGGARGSLVPEHWTGDTGTGVSGDALSSPPLFMQVPHLAGHVGGGVGGKERNHVADL